MADIDGEIIDCTRSLRAKTPQGPIVSLMSSEQIEAPAYFKFTLVSFYSEINAKNLKRILKVGEYYGFSQWRNAGKGRFKIKSFKEKKN